MPALMDPASGLDEFSHLGTSKLARLELSALIALSLVAIAGIVTPAKAQQLRFEPYTYEHQGATVKAELGHLSVPERHDRPNNARIELAFVRLKSISTNPGPPIVYLAGGPGGSGIDLAKGPRGKLFLRMREAGDVIALDQRGVGLSQPNLACSEKLDIPLAATRADAARALNVASRACSRYWRAKGVDLSAYNVVESAHDVDRLRAALGASKLVLWGSSYGTQLGFSVIRHHGDRISRAVFSGVEGPDHTLKSPAIVGRQLAALDRLIAGDARLRSLYPNLGALARRVLESAERAPIRVTVANPGKSPVTVPLGRFDLERVIAGLIGTRAGLTALPATLAALDRKDLSSPYVQQVAQEAVQARSSPLGSAVSYAVDCASGASSARRALIRRERGRALVTDLDFPFPDVCLAWGVPELAAKERAAVRSAVPVLFLSGTLDGQTPVANVEEVIRGFRNGRHVLIEGSGHGNDLFIGSPEIEALTLAFIQSGAVPISRIILPALPIQ